MIAGTWSRARVYQALGRLLGTLAIVCGIGYSYDVASLTTGSNILWAFIRFAVEPVAVGCLIIAVSERIRAETSLPAMTKLLVLAGLVLGTGAVAFTLHTYLADFRGGFWAALIVLLVSTPIALCVLLLLSAGPEQRPLGTPVWGGAQAGGLVLAGAVALVVHAVWDAGGQYVWIALNVGLAPASLGLWLVVASYVQRPAPALGWLAGVAVVIGTLALGGHAVDLALEDDVWVFLGTTVTGVMVGLLILISAGVMPRIPARILAIVLGAAGLAFAIWITDRSQTDIPTAWVFLSQVTVRLGLAFLALVALEADHRLLPGDPTVGSESAAPSRP